MNNVKVAGLGKRFLAFFIDMLLIGLVMQLMALIFKGPYDSAFHLADIRQSFIDLGVERGLMTKDFEWLKSVTDADKQLFFSLPETVKILNEYTKNAIILNAINALVASTLIQFVIPLIIGDGRTLGKVMMHLKVVKTNGAKLDLLSLFLRGFVGATLIEFVIAIPSFPNTSLIGMPNAKLTVLGLPFLVSGCLVMMTGQKRAIHDYIAGTIVTFQDGFEPKVKEKVKEVYDPYHRTAKGFEYIDLEAIEQREKMKQAKLEAEKQAKNPSININEVKTDIVDNPEVIENDEGINK